MIYVWFRRFNENLSKPLDSLLFLATVCSKISLHQQEQVGYSTTLTCRVVDFLNARPYLGYET